jgi:hypothetical protein
MADQPSKQKDEKDAKDEKEVQKHDEKVEERDVLSTVTWALILIWAGVAFLAVSQGWFERLNLPLPILHDLLPRQLDMFEPGVWNLIALGAGIIILLEVVVRLLVPTFRRNIGGSLIVATVFIGIGLGNWFGWNVIWPLILIAVGVMVLIGGFTRKK